MVNCMEVGFEAKLEHDFDTINSMMRRHTQLEIRLERLQRIADKMSAQQILGAQT